MVSLDEMGEKTSEIEDLSKNEAIVAEGSEYIQCEYVQDLILYGLVADC